MVMALMLAVGVTSGLSAPVDQGDEITLRRLRSVDPSIQATIDEGRRRSPTFAALVAHVERSNFIVYVEQVPTLRDGMQGALLHGGSGPQYLRVLLKRGLSPDRRMVVLAHELQHAREVLDGGVAAEGSQMEELFRSIGDARLAGGERQQYETAAALQVTDAVSAELRLRRR